MIGDFTPWTHYKNSPGWSEDERGCHIWTGARSGGYATARVDGRIQRVYRVRYEREIGPIPKGMEMDHYVCDNGAGGCCNPQHCRPVTHRENMLRSESASARNVARGTCPKGHTLVGDNLVRSKLEKHGKRECRLCDRERKRAEHKGRARNAEKTHCPQGHPLSGDNLRPSELRRGRRSCRTCDLERKRSAHTLSGRVDQ